MNAAEIIHEINELCFTFTRQEDIDKWLKMGEQIRDWAHDAEHAPGRLSRLSFFENLSDNELEVLEKFHRGHLHSHPGRKSTVKAARSKLETALGYFWRIPAIWREYIIEIEQEFPRSIVYKAMKALF
jgi:hypothetical protein